jgi:Trk-type K+ transport system membrane component
MKHVDVINKNNIKNIILIHPKFKNIFAKIFFITLLITYLEIIYFYNSPGFEVF